MGLDIYIYSLIFIDKELNIDGTKKCQTDAHYRSPTGQGSLSSVSRKPPVMAGSPSKST